MFDVLIQTLGGLGIFILGMKFMTEGLQMAAGNRIRNVLKAVSNNRVVGFITGAGVTALVQSSSATTVMLISFVSAGLMSLNQAVGVMLGCNVGTTMTAQLIAFKLSSLALPAITIGVPLKYFAPCKKYRYLGEVILGFGLLFFGMTAVFSLVTLPVEFDASKRAKQQLAGSGLLSPQEIKGVDQVLDAAALTYVAAALQAIMTMLYYVSLLTRRN